MAAGMGARGLIASVFEARDHIGAKRQPAFVPRDPNSNA
jgi:hypothetical protein